MALQVNLNRTGWGRSQFEQFPTKATKHRQQAKMDDEQGAAGKDRRQMVGIMVFFLWGVEGGPCNRDFDSSSKAH